MLTKEENSRVEEQRLQNILNHKILGDIWLSVFLVEWTNKCMNERIEMNERNKWMAKQRFNEANKQLQKNKKKPRPHL